MDQQTGELHEIRVLLARLTERVYRLEQAVGIAEAPMEVHAEVQPKSQVAAEPIPLSPTAAPPPPPSFVQQPPAFSEIDTRDLESKIGSQWLNRIGAAAVFIGAYFFLTYAYQNHWIGPSAIVAIGLLAGVGIVFWSERFRSKGYKVFSWSVKGLGIGILYLSLWAGFQVYKEPAPLIPAPYAFAGMVIVTAATIALALAQSAEILALFALIGGFLTPLLLSTGENHELFLFSYVSILNLGTLVLAAYRPWRRLLPVSFVGTLILYWGWYDGYYHDPKPLGLTIAFATIFFVIFALVPLFAMERSTENVSPVLLIVPLCNAVAYFIAVYVLLESISKSAIAWIAVALAAAYIVLSRQLRARQNVSPENARLLTLLHIALAVGFLTAAIPIKLESYWITIGWLVESGVLLYVAYRGASRFLKVLSLVTLVLGIVRLLFFFDVEVNTLLFNPRFAIYMIAIAVVAFAIYLARTQGEHLEAERTLAAIGVVVLNVLAISALCLEAHTFFARQIQAMYEHHKLGQYDDAAYRNLYMARGFAYSAICMIYGAALMFVGFWKKSAFLRWQALVLLAITVLKVFIYDTSDLQFGYRIVAFIALGALLMAVSFVYQRDWLKLSKHNQKHSEGSPTSA